MTKYWPMLLRLLLLLSSNTRPKIPRERKNERDRKTNNSNSKKKSKACIGVWMHSNTRNLFLDFGGLHYNYHLFALVLWVPYLSASLHLWLDTMRLVLSFLRALSFLLSLSLFSGTIPPLPFSLVHFARFCAEKTERNRERSYTF